MTNRKACINMIKQQLRTGDVLDEKILSLYEEIPRSQFVPKAMQPFAYSDMQIPLNHQQRMLSPLEEGRILQKLALTGQERVLEVGTGTGFLTALLSRLAKTVVSVDYYPDFTLSARLKLEQYECNNVELITADAHQGWLEQAPYDIVVMTGAVEVITDSHLLQILPGGKLLAFVGKEPVIHCMLLTLDHQGNWTEQVLFETNTPPLINKLKPKEFVF